MSAFEIPGIIRIHHVGIVVRDVDAAAAIYRRALGLDAVALEEFRGRLDRVGATDPGLARAAPAAGAVGGPALPIGLREREFAAKGLHKLAGRPAGAPVVPLGPLEGPLANLARGQRDPEPGGERGGDRE